MDIDTVQNLVRDILKRTTEYSEAADPNANQEIHQFVVDCADYVIGEMQGRAI